MSRTPQTNPAAGLTDPRQDAFNSLKALLAFAQISRDDIHASPAAHAIASQLCDSLNDQLDALDDAVLAEDSSVLQASVSDLESGITDLKALQAKIQAISDGFKHAAEIISGIDQFIGKVQGLGLF